jgi:glycosyltransferase involved in cell wall biosynthesis
LKKLAIVITHPIQYYVPLFKTLAKQCDLRVFYTWGEDAAKPKYDPDFKQVIDWDIPLLNGYNYEFLTNTAKNQGSHHFSGIKNPDLIKKISLFNPDAILIYGWAYQSHLSALRYFNGKITTWFRGDSTLLDSNTGLKNTLRTLFLTWVYNQIDKAFYVGTNNKNYFLKFGLKLNQLVFAPHAVDNLRFENNYFNEANELRLTFGINAKNKLILFAGKLETKKNPELLLQAFTDLNLPNTHLLFVGNGELEEKLKKEQILRQTQDDKSVNIHFMDFQNQSKMPIVYQACDLFCLPSKGPGETWGLAINEAMASGKAVLVSSKVGCAIDLVENGKNGYLFESENINDLKRKLSILLTSQSDLKQMGQFSKNKIQDWSIKHQADVIIDELNKL